MVSPRHSAGKAVLICNLFLWLQATVLSLCAYLAFPWTCALGGGEGLSLPLPVMSPVKLRPHPSDFN